MHNTHTDTQNSPLLTLFVESNLLPGDAVLVHHGAVVRPEVMRIGVMDHQDVPQAFLLLVLHYLVARVACREGREVAQVMR